MTLEMIEKMLRWSGGLVAWTTLGVILYGIWRGTRHPAGRTSGHVFGWLRSSLLYLLATGIFLTLSIVFWKPLPLTFPPTVRALSLAAGSLTYFPGLAFVLWGRLALGRMYFVSTSFGAQLYADHQLVTSGPFTIVRHPMYLGLLAGAIGSLLLYLTWTTGAFTVFAPFILLRARREERALAEGFGEEWQEYVAHVPKFLPYWKKTTKNKPLSS